MKKLSLLFLLLSVTPFIHSSEEAKAETAEKKTRQKRSVNYAEWKEVVGNTNTENEEEDEDQKRLNSEHQRMIDQQEEAAKKAGQETE